MPYINGKTLPVFVALPANYIPGNQVLNLYDHQSLSYKSKTMLENFLQDNQRVEHDEYQDESMLNSDEEFKISTSSNDLQRRVGEASDSEKKDIVLLKRIIKLYFWIMNKKLKFLLPQLVKLYLVDNICEEVTNRVNTMLYEQDFKELNEEDPKVEKEREMLKSKVENLDAALETILKIKEIKDAEFQD